MANKKVIFDIEANDQTAEGFAGAEENIEGAGGAAQNSGLKFTELSSAMNIANQVVDYAKMAYGALIQPTVDLGLATSKLAGDLGISSEEASTMIQMLEDYGMTQEETTTAMETAVKRGYAPTIEGLAQIADKVKATKDPVEQGTILFDLFGKKGQEVGKLLRGGGEDVLAAANDVKQMGLALSQDQVDDILAYRQSLNDLGDVWASVGMNITKDFIPAVTEALQALGDLLTMRQQIASMVSDTGERLAMEGQSYEYYVQSALDVLQANGQLSQAARNVMEAQLAQGKSLDVLIQGSGVSASSLGVLTREQFNNVIATREAEQATQDAAAAEAQLKADAEAAAAALAASYSTILELAKQLQNETDSYTKKQDDLNSKIADTNAKLADAVGQYGANSQQVRDLNSTIADLTNQYAANEAEHTKATAQIVYNNLQQKLSVGGLTDEEFAMAQQMGVSLGVFTQATANQAIALNGLTTAVINGKMSQEDFARAVNGGRDAIQQEWDKINGIPKNTQININTTRNETYNYNENRTIREARIATSHAAGGEGIVPPGFNNDNFLVGLSSGERFRTVPASRVGAAESGRGGSGGNTYNFYATGMQNPRDFLSWVYDQVELQDGVPQ